jgi:lipopolysaccharide transport system permease protein
MRSIGSVVRPPEKVRHREDDGRGRALSVREAVPVERRARVSDIVTSFPVARVIGARDVKVKYKQSALGPLWLLLQPLGMLVAITIAFSGVTDVKTGDIPYVVFGLVGVTVWTFISATTAIAPVAFMNNSALIRRSPAPRIAFVTATLYSNLPQLGIMCVVTLLATLVTRGFAVPVLVLPLLAVWLMVFTWALVLLIAPVSARFRDAVALVPLIIQAGVFLAPVGFALDSAPQHIRILLSINPVSGIIEGWRWSLLGMTPDFAVIGVGIAWTAALLLVGWYQYGRLEVGLADFI